MSFAPLQPALKHLVVLQTRGKLRRTLRKCQNPRRALLTGLALLLATIWLGHAVVAIVARPPSDPAKFQVIAPWCMLAICLLKLVRLFVNREHAGVAFRRSEVELLLGGPFDRRDVRAYKIVGHGVSVVVTAVCASFFIWPDVPMWLGAFVGSFLAILLTYLLSMIVSVAIVHLSQATYNLVRGVVGGALLATIGYCITTPATGAWSQVHAVDQLCGGIAQLGDSWVGQCALAPFDLVVRVMTAQNVFPNLVLWALPAASMVAALGWFLVRLDYSCDERAIRKEQESYGNRQRGAPLQSVDHSQAATTANNGRRRLPQLPWFSGAGPIAWRQLTGAWHNRTGMLLLLLLFTAGSSALIMAGCDGRSTDAAKILLFLAVQSNLLLPALLPYDFRRDVERLTTLKTLPISSQAVAVGQLFTPVAISSLCQVLVLLLAASMFPHLAGTLLVGVVFLVPANVVMFGLENLVFLLYPYRISEYDVQASMRRIVMLFSKLFALGLAVVFAFVSALLVILLADKADTIGGPVSLISQHARLILLSGWWLTTVAAATTLVCSLGWAFRKFDPTADTPA